MRDYCWPSLNPQAVEKIATKTNAELTMRYEYDGLAKPVEDTEKLVFLGKNDFVFTSLKKEDILIWQDAFDDYPLLAAFITPNEPLTNATGSETAGVLPGSNDQDALRIFIRCFDYLRALGIGYQTEPKGFWTEGFSQYVRYPKDILRQGEGTCLDLSILICALMESVGIKSFVYLTEGHAQPAIELPESGEVFPIEATFIDQEFSLSHYPGATSPVVTAEECIVNAIEYLKYAISRGVFIRIDVEQAWSKGVVPPW